MKSKKSPLTIILVLFALIGTLILAGFVQRLSSPGETEQKSLTSTAIAASDVPMQAPSLELKIESLATPRILGNPEAPVKIAEHSSFTCGACRAFHTDNYKKIKSEYIDTGKAYLVFDDFPRNREDVVIGAIARCVPDSSYFNFVQVVFETQKDWITLGNKFLDNIKNTAIFAGADSDKINQCAESEDLLRALAERRNKTAETHGVNATPTLVINDKTVIPGLSPYEDLQKALDNALNE